MSIQKHHVVFFPVLLVAVIVLGVSFFSWVQILAQTAEVQITCGFTYSDWSECSTSGTQTRTVESQTPSGCVGEPSELSRSCTYTPPSCSYSYSPWSECSSSGRQYRTVASKSPSGCIETTAPRLEQSCTYTPPITVCSFSYSDWSACDSSGRQYRTVNAQTPSGCTGTPETSRNCTYVAPEGTAAPSASDDTPTSSGGGSGSVACSYSFSSWSECSSSGKQTRKLISRTPSGCIDSPYALSRSCQYDAPALSTATVVKPTATSSTSSVIPPVGTAALDCAASCSGWSDCGTDGYQARSCNSPSGCPTTSWIEKNYCGNSEEAAVSTAALRTYSANIEAAGQTATCVYQCSSWGDCLTAGYQERMCQKPYGSSCWAFSEKQYCTIGDPFGMSEEQQAADQAGCKEQCSDWSICSPAGMRFRSCWPAPSGCPGEVRPETESCAPAICRFSYSAWSACQEGFQFRTILAASPEQCVGGTPLLEQACVAAPETEGAVGTQSTDAAAAILTAAVDPEITASADWKKAIFKTTECQDEICGGKGDPDKDGLSNNDEYRYGTAPLDPDTDDDGKRDGEEVALGTNPLQSSAKGEIDKMDFESPKEAGVAKPEIYEVTDVELVEEESGGAKKIRLTGKGPADTYLNVYIYSGDPVIVTVRSDSNGDWTYVVDKTLEDGDHEVYVAVTNSSGAIRSKSQPLPFVKTAQAVSRNVPGKSPSLETAEAKSGISLRSLMLIIGLAIFGVMFAIILIGAIIKKVASRKSAA